MASARLASLLDFLSDLAVAAFAVWTVIAYAGMATNAPVSVLVPIWLATTPFLALALSALRPDAASSPEPARAISKRRAPEGLRAMLPFVGLAAGALTALLAAPTSDIPWVVVWLPAFLAAAAAVAAQKLVSRASSEGPHERAWRTDLFAAATGVVFAVMSLLIYRPNPDDVFYVNRATATAELNHIPVLDVIFTREQVARSGGAGLPVDSYSALQGGLAHVFGVHAASVAYFVFPPVFTFLATWALWRLLRAWAPRYGWICFALGCAFWLFSAQSQLTPGSYFLSRIWQGKVAFVAWLVPTVYVYLSSWLRKRDPRTAVLLLAAGLSAIGMTGSATFVMPLLVLAAAIPLMAQAQWRTLAIPLASAAIPLAVGVFALWRFPLSEMFSQGSLPAQSYFYHEVFGVGVVAAVAGFGVWAAPWIARAGPPERLATGLAVVVAVLLAPGMIALLSDVSGLQETLRRVFWIVPFPAVVGLLAAVPPLARAGRLVPVGAPAALAVGCALVVFGAPLWAYFNHREMWHFPPTWKVYLTPQARTILRAYDGRGPILGPPELMRTIAILTVEPKAVNARTPYLRHTRLSPEDSAERLALTYFMNDAEPVTDEEIRVALSDLQVGLVCIPKAEPDKVARVEELGSFRPSFDTEAYICLER